MSLHPDRFAGAASVAPAALVLHERSLSRLARSMAPGEDSGKGGGPAHPSGMVVWVRFWTVRRGTHSGHTDAERAWQGEAGL